MTGAPPPPRPPEDPQDGYDAAFADIVARLSPPPLESLPPREPSPPREPIPDADTPPPVWREHIPPEDPDDEGYVPPPPAPLPVHDPVFWIALVGCVVGPIWFLYLVATNPHGSRTGMWGAGLLTVVGFALTIFRLPRRAEGDPDDDGARV